MLITTIFIFIIGVIVGRKIQRGASAREIGRKVTEILRDMERRK